MAGLEEELINGIRALPPQQVAIIDRWIDSDPEAVQILMSAVPSLGAMFEPFINGNGGAEPAPAQPQMQQGQAGMNGAAMLSQIAGR
ncbi:MAG: hypothetical protein AXW12_09575 [Thalassospira sp. Nap_22]|nr:MAG: hypothetical protein AXW12_09575 [Thalassospira sp. Nap_22]